MRPTVWIIAEQGPIVPAVGAGVGCFNIFTLLYPLSPLKLVLGVVGWCDGPG